ncbi:MAG: hypothetical protein A2219_01705 [Elusimicrobia bacterium RIFOXYA2_FULL_50_26]|nr:MAG: hypothetical protein A2219_01705 [Elusimicrobia bacterium RIFOXYA2_FULL_50_26]OGS24125.1 MAG: hypothetical protein A2314_09425 [Elusimicrobia bacterium RIFOXYB2_FULL_50_12]
MIGIILGAVFLWLTLRQVDLASCWLYIRQADRRFIALALLAYILAFVVRSVRWKQLLAPLATLKAARLFFFVTMGFFMNNVLPLRLGEVIRANITGQKFNISRSGAFATVVVERLFDGFSYACIFFITIGLLPFPSWAKKSMIAGSSLFVGALVFLFFFVRHKEKALALFSRMPLPQKFAGRIRDIFTNFVSGLTIFAHGRGLIKVILLSLLVWSFEGSVFYIVGKAFNLGLTLPQAFLVMLVIGTGVVLPTAPGYVGTVEFLGVTSLSFIGIDKNLAFGYIITLHFLQLATVSSLGIIGMIREKITLNELIRLEKRG